MAVAAQQQPRNEEVAAMAVIAQQQPHNEGQAAKRPRIEQPGADVYGHFRVFNVYTFNSVDFILFTDGTLSVDGYVGPFNKWHAVGDNLRITWMWGNVFSRPHLDFYIQIHDNLWAHKEEAFTDNRVMVRL